MSTNVYYNKETDDYREVLHRKCSCGHELYQHGFVEHPSLMGYPYGEIWVSQCVACGYDKKNKKYVCEAFH